jgi:hypothetical protein
MNTAGTGSLYCPSGDFPEKYPGAFGLMAVFKKTSSCQVFPGLYDDPGK